VGAAHRRDLMVNIGNDWDGLLKDEWEKPYYRNLRSFLIDEYRNQTVYPAAVDIFNALKLTSYADTKAVILGQDPYHEPGQAQGLAFSVPEGVKRPPSLENILKEVESDVGGAADRTDLKTSGKLTADQLEAERKPADDEIRGVLVPWAKQGVLLLNTVLTVRAHQAGSHRGKGWETFTDEVIRLLAARPEPTVFILWGSQAGAKQELIREAAAQGGARPLVIFAPHPSPLSAYRGFFGGRYFSRTNYYLEDNGTAPVDWTL